MTLSAADKMEIHELVARYNRAVDSWRPEEWAGTFTEDGSFVSMRVGTHTGRAALVKFANDFWTEPECEPWRGGQHWATNIIIEGDGDRATLFCYHIMFMPRGSDHVEPVIMAAHDDELVRMAEGWRFKVRRVVPWPPDLTGPVT